jgi:hypothetical protein
MGDGGERFEVVIDGTDEGMEKDHAELLRRRLVIDGFHEHAVTVQPIKPETGAGREREKGLYEKYEVYKGNEPVSECFVLEPGSDAAAREAISAYADETADEDLADDLRDWIRSIESDAPSDSE